MENLKLQDLDVKLGFFTNVLGTLSKLPKLSQTGQISLLFFHQDIKSGLYVTQSKPFLAVPVGVY